VVPTAIEVGRHIGVNRVQYQIHIPLPPKTDPTVTMMQEEVMETPLLHVIQPKSNILTKERST
jgi:ATP-dependent 26S proteasome regulatory subunit